MLNGLVSSLLDSFYGSLHIEPDSKPLAEPFCQCCALPFEGLAQHTKYCFNCNNVTWKFHRARSAFRMEGNVRELIHEFKYRGEHWLRRVLGEWMYQTYETYYLGTPYSGIVPVPLSIVRYKKRGFNQARELGSYLSRKTKIPLKDCLTRKVDNVSQSGLTRSMRIKNVQGIFDIKKKFHQLSGNYLLIDDVLTTGSTASACAAKLLRAGASSVDVLTVARA